MTEGVTGRSSTSSVATVRSPEATYSAKRRGVRLSKEGSVGE